MLSKFVNGIMKFDIVKSTSRLRGNRRTLVTFEPLFGISFVLFNFYMSLYMKQIGVTNAQLGYISSIGYISAAFFSFLGGPIVDRIGRRKSMFIADLIGWGGALSIWFFANNFYMFVLAAIFNNLVRISMVSFMCFVSEGSANEERVATYNIKNIANLCVGILVPIAGIVVGHYGIITGQRILLSFGFVGIIVMDFARYKLLNETEEGLLLIKSHKASEFKLNIINAEALKLIFDNKIVLFVMLAGIFQQLFVVINPFSGIFFAPFFSEIIKFDKSQISYLGSINSFVMLLVFLFIIPYITKRKDSVHNLLSGIVIQMFSIICMVMIPKGNFAFSAVSMTVYALGYSVTRAFIDSVLVNVTEFKEKAGIYAIYNGVSCLLSIFAAAFSGIIYNKTPYLLAMIALACLVVSCMLLIVVLMKKKHTIMNETNL